MSMRPLLVAVLGLALTACASRVNGPFPRVLPADPAVVPTTVTMRGATLALETYLNRDFFPVSPPDGRPLAAFVRVRSTNGAPLPIGLSVAWVGVYFQGQVWSSAAESQTPSDPSAVEAIARNGPKWGPGGTADVVVILSLAGEPRMLLRAADQPIHRSD